MSEEDVLLVEDELVNAFVRDLRQLKGNRTYKEIARLAGFSQSTIHEAAAGKKLPTLDVLLAFVGACGGKDQYTQDEWRRRHEDLVNRGTGASKELARARAEIGRLGAELERLRQVCDAPETAAFRAERQRKEAQRAQQRAQENLRQLREFSAGLTSQVDAAEQHASRVLEVARDRAERMMASAEARAKSAADTAAQYMHDAQRAISDAEAEATRVRKKANEEAGQILQEAHAAAERIEQAARTAAEAKADELLNSEIVRRRELAVRVSDELISAAGANAQAQTVSVQPVDSGASETADGRPDAVERARAQAAQIIERAQEQAEVIRRTAMNGGVALESERTRLAAEVERLQSRLQQRTAPVISGNGRHRRASNQTPDVSQPAQAGSGSQPVRSEQHGRIEAVRAALSMTKTDRTTAALAAIGPDLAAALNAMDPGEIAARIQRLDGGATPATLLAGMSPERGADVVAKLDRHRASAVLTAMKVKSRAQLLEKLNPNTAASILAAMDPADAVVLLRTVDGKRAHEVIRSIGKEAFVGMLRTVHPSSVAAVLDRIPVSAATEVLQTMDHRRVDAVLSRMSPDPAGIIRTRLNRPRRPPRTSRR